MSWLTLAPFADFFSDHPAFAAAPCVASVVRVHDGYLALWSGGLTAVLRPTFVTLDAAQAAFASLVSSRTTQVVVPADDVWDTPWRMMRFDPDAWGRRAGGAAVRVDQAQDETRGRDEDGDWPLLWTVTIDRRTLAQTFPSWERARDYVDAVLPPPSPCPLLEGLAQDLRKAVRYEARLAMARGENRIDLAALHQRIGPLLRLLRQTTGMDGDGEARLLATLASGGRPVLWQAGYAGVLI